MESYSLLLVFFLLLFGLWLIIQFLYFVLFKRNISFFQIYFYFRHHLFLRKNQPVITGILNKIRYYQRLPEEKQRIFVNRVVDFILSKDFIPRQMPEVTIEQKVLISAAAIQLTFGIDHYLLRLFSEIFVFPREYYSIYKHEYHKGETNLAGAIALSYEDLYKTYYDLEDGLNLGLHEMAHALKFDLLIGEDADELFNYYFDRWQRSAKSAYADLQGKETSILRDYAKANINEFFAVCVENFFERPGQLKNEFPELYHRLKILLNQDPEKDNPVDTLPRLETRTSIPEEFVPQNLLFISTPSFSRIALPLIPFIFLSVWALLSFPFEVRIAVLLSIPVLGFLVSLQKSTYLVFENCLVIKPYVLSKLHADVYEYSRIDYIILSDYRPGRIEIKYNDHNKIRTKRYSWSQNGKDLVEFRQWLMKFEVRIST